MRCPRCGKELSNDTDKCPYCSQRLAFDNYAISKSLDNERKKQNDRLKSIYLTISAVLLVLGIIFSGACFYKYNRDLSRYKASDEYLFFDNLTPVYDGNYWGYINKSGSIIIKPSYTLAFSFSDSLAPVCTDKNEYFYISRAKKTVLGPYPMTLSKVSGFYDGYALVPTEDNKVLYITKSGNVLGDSAFSDGRPFKNGYAAVMAGGKWGFIRSDGNITIDFEYDETGDFSYDGYVAVKKNGKWGFIDKGGHTVIDFKYDSVHDFVCGLCAVHTKMGWTFIDRDGRAVTDEFYSDVTDFAPCLLAGVNINGKWGFIDTTGKIKIEPRFMGADKFMACDMAVVKTENGFGVINTRGDFVMNDNEVSLSLYDDGYAVFSNEDKTLYGIYDVNRKRVIIKPTYRFISYDRTYYYNTFSRYKTF